MRICLCGTKGEDDDNVEELQLRNLHSFLHREKSRGGARKTPLPPLLPLPPPRLGRGADELIKPGPLRPRPELLRDSEQLVHLLLLLGLLLLLSLERLLEEVPRARVVVRLRLLHQDNTTQGWEVPLRSAARAPAPPAAPERPPTAPVASSTNT